MVSSHYVEGAELNKLNESCKKLFLNCKKGDLALIDLKQLIMGLCQKKEKDIYCGFIIKPVNF